MKKITKQTVLKQGDKTFKGVNVDSVIYWIDGNIKPYNGCSLIEDINSGIFSPYENGDIVENPKVIRAQSQYKLKGVPVVNLDKYIERLAMIDFKNNDDGFTSYIDRTEGFISGYKSNPNQYTLKDIEKATELAKSSGKQLSLGTWNEFSKKEIIEKLNTISLIEVDKQFNILSYE